MSDYRQMNHIDRICLIIMASFFLVFLSGTRGEPHFISAVAVFSAALLIAILQIKKIDIKWYYRVAVSTLVVLISAASGGLRSGRFGLLVFFALSLTIFSTSTSRNGFSLRVLSGLCLGILLFGGLPFVYACAFSLLLILIIIASLIGSWSGMRLWPALVWFSKRSVRKETVFLILFLAGISAIGLRQAQEYASRQSGLSGLSRVLSPGSIMQLSMSSALAMRVSFSKPHQLKESDLYFRGETMDRVISFNWTAGPTRIRSLVRPTESDLSYDVALSSRYSDFLPVLDYGVYASTKASNPIVYSARDNGVFQSSGISNGWQYFSAWSRLEPVHQLQSNDGDNLLQTPSELPQDVIALAKSLSPDSSVQKFVANFGQYLQKQGFEYTLRPGEGSSNISDFIFKSRRGYCEHYASAAALLARLAGIPARVVAGFQGGQWDQARTTLYVRDLDAHAWVEVWDRNTSKWSRFDPVIFVAPDRVNFGASSYLRSIGVYIPNVSYFKSSIIFANMLMALDNLISVMGDGSIVNFGGVFIDYGEELSLLGAAGLLVSYIMLRIRRYRLEYKSRDLLYVEILSSVLDGKGLGKLNGEPVDSWLSRVSTKMSVLGPHLRLFSESFSRYRYSSNQDRSDLEVMKQSLKSIKRLI